MKNRFSLILFLLFLFSNAVFAQGAAHISGNLLKKASQVKTIARTSFSVQEKIDVLFYPEEDNTDNIDTSFFTSRGIEYIRSRSFLSAEIPAGIIPELDTIKGVKYAGLNTKVKALGIVSEGRDKINASAYTYTGVTGAGIKIAVVDIGFLYFSHLQSIGELPPNIITKDFTRQGYPSIVSGAETEAHGSGCAEVIYDIVPDAQMYLLKVKDSATMQLAFDYCKTQGIKVVSCSLGFSYDFWCDGTGDFAKIATDAYNSGILPVFAAGNEAEYSWFGMFNGNTDNWMIFPGGKDYLEINIYALGLVYMMWDDFDAKDKEYTLYMYESDGRTLIDSSLWVPGDIPSVYAWNLNLNSKKVKLKIKKENTAEPVNIRLCFDGYYTGSSERRSESSLSSPADSREAIAVGAMSAGNWSGGPIDSYSSRGPTRKPSNAGTLLTETQKPDIVGPSYVTTFSYGSMGFNGTSAATPHIAASAVLLLSLDPAMSVVQLKDKVLSYHRQIRTSPDNIYGRGKFELSTESIPGTADAGDIICYPNPVSISRKDRVYITNFPYTTGRTSINVYTVAGEFVKSFNSSDIKTNAGGRRTIEWDMKNQSGTKIAPGVYFVTIDAPGMKKKVRKIAVQK